MQGSYNDIRAHDGLDKRPLNSTMSNENESESKYSVHNITQALLPWEMHKNTYFAERSIKSQIFLSKENYTIALCSSQKSYNCNTNLLFTKYRDTTGTLNFLQHWFIDINNDLRWHPGCDKKSIFLEQAKDNALPCANNTKLSIIHELCDRCTYWYLYDKFLKDSYFNILLYNCELIADHYVETLLGWSIFSSMLGFLLSGYYIFMALTLSLMVFLMLSTKRHDTTVRIFVCPHIKVNISNVKVIHT